MTITAPTTAPTTTVQAVTCKQIEESILAVLESANTRELVPWRNIRPQLPGEWWQQTQALTCLFESRAVYVIAIEGKNYCRLEHGRNAPGPVLGHPREFRVL
jgi:hypothetical protein